jgi:predicted nucleic acid-binding protein
VKKYFIDTNVIIYANDSRFPAKQDRAIAVIHRLMSERCGVISTQVMQEYASVALKKLEQRPDVVMRQLALLEGFEVVPVVPALIRRSIEIRTTFQISFWDACIVSAAEHTQCDTIFSEDFAPGRFYSGIAVKNPFNRE